jgi:hypothetical protein
VAARSYDELVVLHMASQGGPHIALVALLILAAGLAGFFAVSGSTAGPSALGLSRDNAVAIACGLLAGFILIVLLLV